MAAETKRILLVDDFASWQGFIKTLLSVTPEWQLCAEAINGVEALSKAEELHPDLVLLDLDLPDASGIEVARRLQTVQPTPKIVFLTSESSPHVVKAALGAGALGYILKSQVVDELLPALKEIFSGNRFISFGVKLD